MAGIGISLIVTAAVFVLCAFGLAVKPRPFAPYPGIDGIPDTVPIPEGLPEPVQRFYRKIYGDTVPVVTAAILSGRAFIKPFGVPLPARFVFVHEPGRAYRHYFEATFFGVPVLRVNEGIADGKSFFESPMGTFHDDPNTNQGANLALWAEGMWFPSLFLTDKRVRWAPLDPQTAVLYVPYGASDEAFTVRFDPQTGLMSFMEAMRFRNPRDTTKVLWLASAEKGNPVAGIPVGTAGSAMWLDQGKPWATFRIEHAAFNRTNIHTFVRARGI